MASILSTARSPWVIGGVIAAWGAETIAAFWNLEAQYLRPAPRPRGAIVAHPDQRPAPPIAFLTTSNGVANLRSPGTTTVLKLLERALSVL